MEIPEQTEIDGGITMGNRYELNKNLAQMLKGGVIMDVTTPEQAKIAEAARSEERRVGKECRSRWSPYH